MVTSDRALDDDARRSRHVSMRVPVELFDRLESAAAEHNESVSQTARRLIGSGLEPGGRNAIDDAITLLMSVRDRHLPRSRVPDSVDHGSSAERRPAPKRIDILNAKTDLQRLLVDVSHGHEFVITHAGAPRARLVAVEHHGPPTTIRNR